MSKKEIFISYGREPEVKQFVRKLRDDLQNNQFTVWLDETDIPAGADFREAIGTGLCNCSALIAIITKKYIHSRYCKNEFYYATSDEKRIYPIIYEEVDFAANETGRGVKSEISGINWTMMRPRVDDYEESLDKLMQGLAAFKDNEEQKQEEKEEQEEGDQEEEEGVKNEETASHSSVKCDIDNGEQCRSEGDNADHSPTVIKSSTGSYESLQSMDVNVKLRLLQHLSIGINAQVKGDIFMFKGGSDDVGVVKILEPMSPMFNYFEYEIIDRGEKCAIGIGVGELNYPLDRMPGWNANGIGYHADDGCLFNQIGSGIRLGPTCTVGDRMGCGVDFDTDVGYGYVRIFFTKNGQQVKKPIKMKKPIHGLYPLVGMDSCGEQVRYLGHCRRLPDSVLPCKGVDMSPWQCSNGVKFLNDGLTVEYCGNGVQSEGQDVGVAQSLKYCMERGNHHFEMEIVKAGKGGMLAIGLAASTYPFHLLPGSSKESIAYYANNGGLFREGMQGVPFGPTCTEGDTVGCGIQCDDVQAQGRVCNVFFTKNHLVVGSFQCPIPEGGFCPIVALLSHGAMVKVTFESWTSDMESMLRDISVLKPASESIIGSDEMLQSMDANVKLRLLQHLSIGINDQVEGDIFMFKGGSNVGVVKILEPMSPMFNYFEYEIIDKGERCAIGIGVGELNYPLDQMPGWNANGIGYHADDGCLFNQRGSGIRLGPTSTTGDRMGCGVDFDTDVGYGYVSIFFTKNGQQVSKSIKMKRPIHGLYPLVGMHSCGEKVRYLGHWRRLPDSVLPCMGVDISPWQRSNGVKFLNDGLTVEYCGKGGQDVGVAQSLKYCMKQGNHHFEMVIVKAGKGGMLAIGLAASTYPLHLLPGSSKGSIAYHTNNGGLFREGMQGVPFGPTCTDGDTVGCGIQCDDVQPQGRVCNVFFTKNHLVVGSFQCPIPEGGFCPTVTLLGRGAMVKVMFESRTSDMESMLRDISVLKPSSESIIGNDSKVEMEWEKEEEEGEKEEEEEEEGEEEEDEEEDKKELHPRVKCDDRCDPDGICNVCEGLIYGTRFACLKCDNYDLCWECKERGFHSEHKMRKTTTVKD